MKNIADTFWYIRWIVATQKTKFPHSWIFFSQKNLISPFIKFQPAFLAQHQNWDERFVRVLAELLVTNEFGNLCHFPAYQNSIYSTAYNPRWESIQLLICSSIIGQNVIGRNYDARIYISLISSGKVSVGVG